MLRRNIPDPNEISRICNSNGNFNIVHYPLKFCTDPKTLGYFMFCNRLQRISTGSIKQKMDTLKSKMEVTKTLLGYKEKCEKPNDSDLSRSLIPSSIMEKNAINHGMKVIFVGVTDHHPKNVPAILTKSDKKRAVC